MFDLIAFCPFRAPIIEKITDNTHPLQTQIHIKEIQKLGSTIAEIMPGKLQMTGTYQILLGFSFIIKKQPKAITKSNIIYAKVLPVLPPIPSPMPNNKINAPKKVKMAKTALGILARDDLFPLVSIIWSI